jgi:anaerobic selenocysteine-containing dehydrogenase
MLAKLASEAKEPYWSPIVKWVPPMVEPKENEFRVVYSRSPMSTHSSTFDNPLLANLMDESQLYYKGIWINAKKAEEMGIKSGDRIVIESVHTGDKTEGIAFATELIREDTIFMVSGFGQESEKLSFSGGSAFMRLAPLRVDTLSGSTMNHEFAVRIRKA